MLFLVGSKATYCSDSSHTGSSEAMLDFPNFRLIC